MGYQGVTGWKTVFPTAPSAGSGSAASSAGGRSSGTVAKGTTKAKKARARRPLKVPRTLSYPKVTEKNPLRAPTKTELVAGAIGAKGAQRFVSQLATKVKGLPASGNVGAALIVGAIAYGLTKAALTKYSLKKATLRENAARAADAYRFARTKMASDQGRPLTATQQKQLANAFKNELLKLGLSSNDLSKIMGRSAYDPTQQAALGG